MSGAPKPRRTTSLAKSLDKQLYTLAARANCRLTYAAAVSAAGATVMSLAPVAEARIIYTPTHMKIAPNSLLVNTMAQTLTNPLNRFGPSARLPDWRLANLVWRNPACPSRQACRRQLPRLPPARSPQ